MDLANDLHMDPPAVNSLGGSLPRTKNEDEGPDSSLKTDTAIKDPLHESPALPDLLSSQILVDCNLTKKDKKRRRKKDKHNAVESKVNDCGTPKNTFSSKTSAPALDMPTAHPIQCVSTDPVMKQSCVEVDICQGENEEKEQNMLKKAAEKSNGDKGPDSSLKTDTAIKDPLHESPALPDLLSSQILVECNLTKKDKKRKRQKDKHNVVESKVNDCGTPKNTFSSKTSAPALDMPAEHPIQCVSTDPVMKQSCVEVDICQGENEEKEQNMLKKAAEKSNGGKGPDSSLKTESAIKDPLHESPALPDLLSSQILVECNLTKKDKKRKRQKDKHNAVESKVNDCGTPKNTFSSKTSAPALDMPTEHPIQCVSTDPVMKQSCVEVDICQGENEEKEQKMLKKAAEKSNGGKGPDSSLKTDTVIKDPLHESPALPDLLSSQILVECNLTKKDKKRKRQKDKHNAVESKVNDCGTPKNTFSSKTSAPALDMPTEHPIQCVSTDPVMKQSRVEVDICQGENEEKEQNMLKKAAVKSNGDKGPDSSLKTDTAIKDPLHESPALPDLLSSQILVECNLTKKDKKRKRQKDKHNAVESKVNDCGTPKTFSSKTSAPALDIPTEHPIQCMSTDPVMKQSCVEVDICQGENEEKEQNMLKKAAEKSNGECEVQEVSSDCNSVVANAEFSAKESVLEVVKMNMEQSIHDNSSNPEEKSDSIKNVSLVKKHDYDFSDKFQNVKTYTRRKILIPVNCNKEPTLQDHQKDDSHKLSDEPLTVGLMEREAKLPRDQITSHSGAAAEEMKLMTESTSEQRFMTMSSAVDIPVMKLEETNARQLDHTEVTGNDLCCPGDVSDLNLVTINDGNSKISQFSLGRTIISNSKNKLLILDVNGLLADCVSYVPRGYKPEPDFWFKRRKVYKRPFCDDFLQFCFDRFHVGVWSSRSKSNVDEVIKFLMGKSASKLLFCWNQSHCTTTKFSTVENRDKPLVLKELWKLWEKVEQDLPWEKGEFNESNTLLLDDSPYKALVNPMYTAIFPYSYQYYNTADSSLGPGGDLRVYLEGLALADNVQEYVSSNPFGQRPIRETNASWGYYRKVIESVKPRQYARPSSSGRVQTAYRTMQDESCSEDSHS